MTLKRHGVKIVEVRCVHDIPALRRACHDDGVSAARLFGCHFSARMNRVPMPRRIESTDLPEDLARIAEAQVAAGRFASVEDVVRAGVAALEREQQRYDAKLAKLRAAIEDGDASPDFEGDPFASVRAEIGLAPSSR
jgi:antitoxin ParD1/3/4